jgi:hypothetical protein
MSLSPGKSAWLKVRWIFLPWLVSMIGIGVGFATLAHVLVIEEGSYTVADDYVFIVGLVCVLMLYGWVLHPRIRLLELAPGGEDLWRGFFHLVVVAGLCLSVVLCLRVAQSSMGTVVKLNHASDGTKAPRVQYYELANSYLDTNHVVDFDRLTIESSGRSGTRYWVSRFYFAMPILDVARDTIDSICHAWLCKDYEEQFPYSHERAVDNSVERFRRDARARFGRHVKGKLLAFEAVGNDAGARWFDFALEKSTHYRSDKHLLLRGLAETVNRQNNKLMVEVLVYWVFGGLVVLGMVMLPDWNPKEVKRFLERKK